MAHRAREVAELHTLLKAYNGVALEELFGELQRSVSDGAEACTPIARYRRCQSPEGPRGVVVLFEGPDISTAILGPEGKCCLVRRLLENWRHTLGYAFP